MIFECARAKTARKSWDLLHRSCWVTFEISTLRTSPRMKVPLLLSNEGSNTTRFRWSNGELRIASVTTASKLGGFLKVLKGMSGHVWTRLDTSRIKLRYNVVIRKSCKNFWASGAMWQLVLDFILKRSRWRQVVWKSSKNNLENKGFFNLFWMQALRFM